MAAVAVKFVNAQYPETRNQKPADYTAAAKELYDKAGKIIAVKEVKPDNQSFIVYLCLVILLFLVVYKACVEK